MHTFLNTKKVGSSLRNFQLLSFIGISRLALDSSYTGEYLTLDSLEKSTTTSRDV